MSQRALRRRDQMLNTYKQQSRNNQVNSHQNHLDAKTNEAIDKNGNLNDNGSIAKDKFGSTPNLHETSDVIASANASTSTSHVENSLSTNDSSRSESDLTRLRDETTLMNAKSEFHLKSIASTRVDPLNTRYKNSKRRDRTTKTTPLDQNTSTSSPLHKMSTRSAPTSSQLTSGSISSILSDSVHVPPRSPSIGFADTSAIRVPIVGYEVMEERARFTVRVSTLPQRHYSTFITTIDLLSNDRFHFLGIQIACRKSIHERLLAGSASLHRFSASQQ